MTRDEMALLFDYNYWADHRILDTTAVLTQEQFAAPWEYSRGGVRATLAHVLDGERTWRMTLQSGLDDYVPMFDEVNEKTVPTLDDLRRAWQEEEQAMRGYLAGLKDAQLSEIVRYTTDEGDKRARVRWHILVHLVNHGTQHRSEVAYLLTSFGHSPGDVDFTLFLNETGRAKG